MTTGRSRHAHAATAVAVLLAAAFSLHVGACTPVPLPPTDDGQLAVLEAPGLAPGDPLPPIELIDVEGLPITNAMLQGPTTVLWFAAPAANGGRTMSELSARIAAVEHRLLPPSRERFQVLVVLLTDSADAAWQSRAQLHEMGSAWRIVALPHEQVLELAAACGVVSWSSDEGTPEHNVRLFVIDSAGRIADVFSGLDEWSRTELLASVSQAMR